MDTKFVSLLMDKPAQGKLTQWKVPLTLRCVTSYQVWWYSSCVEGGVVAVWWLVWPTWLVWLMWRQNLKPTELQSRPSWAPAKIVTMGLESSQASFTNISDYLALRAKYPKALADNPAYMQTRSRTLLFLFSTISTWKSEPEARRTTRN